jgi:phosphoribosylformylglycinamidine synthase
MQQIEFVSTENILGKGSTVGDCINIPINHFEGNFVCPPEALAELETQGQIVFRYTDNPNGSTRDIAGICNKDGNVVGMMPHPERATSALLGSTDGTALIQSFLTA